MSFLPALSIRNLMVNRTFRQICERILYRNIRLPYTPGRTLHLCKTFVLRPDLALRVQDLDVYLRWYHVIPRRENEEYTLPKFSQRRAKGTFTPVEALALAKNVKSFSVRGIAWVPDRDMAPIRELAGTMKLTRLTIDTFPSLPNPEPRYNKEIVSYLRAVLQAQPLLEHLELPFFFELTDHVFPPTPETAPLSEKPSPLAIERSDIPNLRSLIATASVAVSLLPVAPKLEKLSILSWGDKIRHLLPYSEQYGHRIRSLGLQSRLKDFAARGDWVELLSHFPNVETCIFTVWWLPKDIDVATAGSCLDWVRAGCRPLRKSSTYKSPRQVSRDIHLLPLLREFELDFGSNYTPKLKLSEEQMMEFKRSCPRLESVIDPSGDIWTYRPKANQEEGFQHLGRLSPEQRKIYRDIPNPGPSLKTSSSIWAIWK
ncbi:hypothetical protein FRC05_005125 [Tulasnella sp. 425]|nr:hypothetical protein FRC05_005125 [Tulasnella sp. 425]